ncbi:MAG: hypothetical protein PVS3B1_24540 [Ktedonobacteraceae bacterium]
MEQEHAKNQASTTAIKPFEQAPHLIGRVPKWSVSLGILLSGIIYFFLPGELTFGPSWDLLAVELVILLPLWIFWASGRALPPHVLRRTSLLLLAIVTLALATGVLLLIIDLSSFKSGLKLLRTAGLLWAFNILVFALWYWDTDGGGPRSRHEAGHKASDLMFPQQANGQSWMPDFFDYLFVAFTASTAFSPTDTYPLTIPAKFLMMIQSIISLMLVAVVVSRVANIF